MVVQLCPLAIRPELYITDERPPYGPLNAFIYTKSKPHVLLTSKKCCRRQREISLWIEGVAGQDTRNFHYAGSFNQAMYFYREKNSDFEPDLLIEWNVVNMRMQGIRAAEHPNVLFFHRQPYYLIRTGPEICQIRHFELHRPPINVNYKPLPLKNPMLLYKDGTLFILRKGSDERLLEASKNIVDIQHPLLNNECTAFVDADEPVIYVSLHSNAKLMIINAKSFGIQIVELYGFLGLGVDIRYASRGLLIFAEVFHTAPYTNLSFGQLEDRYWKPTSNPEKPLINDLASLPASEIYGMAKPELANDERGEKDKEQVVPAMSQELACANAKISQLMEELSSVQLEFEEEKRTHSESEMNRIREERDQLGVEKLELLGKYRRLLLQVGRSSKQPEPKISPEETPILTAPIKRGGRGQISS